MEVIFECTVLYELSEKVDEDDSLTGVNKKTQLGSAKIYGFTLAKPGDDEEQKSKQQLEEKRSWLRQISLFIARKENIRDRWFFIRAEQRPLIARDEVQRLKKLLLNLLKDEPRIIENSELRDKVLDFLTY